jgi:glycerol-3-phosphate dehydrogenase
VPDQAATDPPVTPAPAGPAPTSPLARRSRDLARLADERWDLLVVGGGIVGAGALLDAASRGLKVALVEQDDVAAGTSSRSSRLIHGGLRYLQQFEVGLVREALSERARLLRLAPHLVRLETFLFPLYGPPAITRAFYAAGMTMYDLLGSRKSGGHRHLSPRASVRPPVADLARLAHLRWGRRRFAGGCARSHGRSSGDALGGRGPATATASWAVLGTG